MIFHVINRPKHRFAGVQFAPLFSGKAEVAGVSSRPSPTWTWIAERVLDSLPARLALALGRFHAHRRQSQRVNDLRRCAYRAWLAENPRAAALSDQILVTDIALKLLLVSIVVMAGAFVYPAVPDAGVVMMALAPIMLWLYRWLANQRERETVATAIVSGISTPEQLKLLSGLSGFAPGAPSIRNRIDDETTLPVSLVTTTVRPMRHSRGGRGASSAARQGQRSKGA